MVSFYCLLDKKCALCGLYWARSFGPRTRCASERNRASAHFGRVVSSFLIIRIEILELSLGQYTHLTLTLFLISTLNVRSPFVLLVSLFQLLLLLENPLQQQRILRARLALIHRLCTMENFRRMKKKRLVVDIRFVVRVCLFVCVDVCVFHWVGYAVRYVFNDVMCL